MKILITTLALALMPAFPSYADDAKVPHPEGGAQTRANGLFSPTRYSFRFHVTGYTLSELKFTAPEGMRLNQSIDISDQNGQKVMAMIALQGQVAVVTFAQPVALGSRLSFDLNDVKTKNNGRIWELETSGKIGNLKEDISLQTIRLSPRGR
jgi:Arc/MetJ family transcription regulator